MSLSSGCSLLASSFLLLASRFPVANSQLATDNTAVLTNFFNDTHGVKLSVDKALLKAAKKPFFGVTFATLSY